MQSSGKHCYPRHKPALLAAEPPRGSSCRHTAMETAAVLFAPLEQLGPEWTDTGEHEPGKSGVPAAASARAAAAPRLPAVPSRLHPAAVGTAARRNAQELQLHGARLLIGRHPGRVTTKVTNVSSVARWEPTPRGSQSRRRELGLLPEGQRKAPLSWSSPSGSVGRMEVGAVSSHALAQLRKNLKRSVWGLLCVAPRSRMVGRSCCGKAGTDQTPVKTLRAPPRQFHPRVAQLPELHGRSQRQRLALARQCGPSLLSRHGSHVASDASLDGASACLGYTTCGMAVLTTSSH